ncbi:MAG: hypothetical protein RLZZ292_1406 [Bacteroidota bacterium]
MPKEELVTCTLPFVQPDCVVASMIVPEAIRLGNWLLRLIIQGALPPKLKVMVCAKELVFAHIIASRSEPAPASLVLVTTHCAESKNPLSMKKKDRTKEIVLFFI